MKVNYLGERFDVKLHKTSFLRRGVGLMFRTKNTENLLFDFKKDVRISITSFFVFFPFLILWLDEKNNVLEWEIVKPFVFSLRPSCKFRKFVEVPINYKNRRILSLFRRDWRKV